MKKLFVFVLLGGFVLPSASWAIDLKQAKFTQVVNSVDVISQSAQGRHAAAVNDVFTMPDVLRTGPDSRAELVAADNTITRVGANTVFSYDPATRTIDFAPPLATAASIADSCSLPMGPCCVSTRSQS